MITNNVSTIKTSVVPIISSAIVFCLPPYFNTDFFPAVKPYFYRVIFFTGTPPKSSKYKIKLEYQDWYPPKSSKCQPVSKFSKKKVKVPGLVPP